MGPTIVFMIASLIIGIATAASPPSANPLAAAAANFARRGDPFASKRPVRFPVRDALPTYSTALGQNYTWKQGFLAAG